MGEGGDETGDNRVSCSTDGWVGAIETPRTEELRHRHRTYSERRAPRTQEIDGFLS